jgi:nitrogen fixation/metabolism regulation signal transduction histidine kinase
MIRFEARLLFFFSVLFLAAVAFVLIVDIRTERQLVYALEKDLGSIVNTVHISTLKLSTESGSDREGLERFIGEAKKNKAVREISVVGKTREVIASSNPERVGKRHELSGQEIIIREQFGNTKETDNKIRYEVRVPLLRNNEVIGLVQAFIEVEDYRHLLHKIYLRHLLIACGVLVIAFGTIFIVINRLNRPLRRLVAAADQVASGDLTAAVEPGAQDEMGRLAEAFNAMTRKLAEEQQLETKLRALERRGVLVEMAASLAHEIRNPLNLINLTADHLAEKFKPEGNEKRASFEELIKGLKTEVRELNRMVTEFLNVGRPLKLKRSTFAWSDLLEQVQRSVKPQLLAKEISLEIFGQTWLTVNADRDQIRMIVLNLLLNAVEAVSEKGCIAIDVRRADDMKGVAVSITDDGSGIAAQDLPHIFEPYFTTRAGGTGLGLALVRRAVEEHGGTIRAGNAEGAGARFEFTLPMEA